MTIEQLQDRIAKKQKDIEKINKRIAKWSKGLRQQDITVCEPFGNCVYGDIPRYMSWRDFHGTSEYQEASRNFKNYVDTHNDIPTSEDWSKGPRIYELRDAYRDLGEAKHILEKYQLQLANLNKFESEEKIEVIWNFLMTWKERARDWYLHNCERYFNLKKDYEKAHKEFEDRYDGNPAYYLEREWKKEYFYNIDSLTKEITHCHREYIGRYPDERVVYISYDVDKDALEKALDKDVKAKYTRLVEEVTSITGEITDATALRIGAKGDINGIVVGTLGRASVNTFSAGGYAVQCFHFRTKVTRLKESN